ncbi:large subunit ribosomal protein L20 [Mytilus galloprovincialis]|uniref:Large subunit ribosomal protein L20 n=2 Tax=Mytilus galloprovincialis TaxID=29158 RepID=A0A8B6H4U5_MYTGA|nr:large subunit ribosomal protein L20 [Mytilus galloprovincialis]
MVFLSIFRNVSTMYTRKTVGRCPKPDKYWKRSMYFRMMWKYYGRRQHIYSIGAPMVHRALRYSTKSTQLKKKYMREMWTMRLGAACNQHGIEEDELLSSLTEANIPLNRKVLTDLSIYEPRSFQSLATFAKQRNEQSGLSDALKPTFTGILTHGHDGDKKK